MPYTAEVLLGGIGYDHSQAQYALPVRNRTTQGAYAGVELRSFKREMHLSNYFSVPIRLQSATTATCGDILTVEKLRGEPAAGRLQKWPPITLRFNALAAWRINNLALPFTCFLDLVTNVSTSHRIPLYVMDGHVSAHLRFEVSLLCSLFNCT